MERTKKELRYSPTHKNCPFCNEKILRKAMKCKFCGEFLTESNKKLQRIYEKKASLSDIIAFTFLTLLWLLFILYVVWGIFDWYF